MIGLRIIVIMIFGFLAVRPGLTQTLPSCRSLAADADGDGFGWENGASCVVTPTSLPSPSFTNLETGNPVNLVRAQWDSSVFTGSPIQCFPYRFDGSTYQLNGFEILYYFEPLSPTAPFIGNVRWNPIAPGAITTAESWTIDNGIYFGPSVLATTPWVEIVEREATTSALIPPDGNRDFVRVWTRDTSFTLCQGTHPYIGFAPVRSAQTESDNTPDNCDYSNADQFDGWGWDAVAGQSCAPIDSSEPANSSVTGSCDYTDAAQFNGWGWDPVAGQSCAPIDSSAPTNAAPTNSSGSGNCDYSNAAQFDGWGWNAVTGQSCEPLTSESPTTASMCIDSDGDGWGWDGTQSCRVE